MGSTGPEELEATIQNANIDIGQITVDEYQKTLAEKGFQIVDGIANADGYVVLNVNSYGFVQNAGLDHLWYPVTDLSAEFYTKDGQLLTSRNMIINKTYFDSNYGFEYETLVNDPEAVRAGLTRAVAMSCRVMLDMFSDMPQPKGG